MVEQERAKVHLRVVRFVAKVILGPSHSVVLCTLVYNFSFRRPLHACLQLQAAPQSVTVSFFQRPPHRLVADRVHDRQRDQLVGQELHRPLVAARRRRRAGQSDEPGLGRPIAFALAAGPLLLLATQGVVQALLDEALADALDGSDADLDRLADALVGPGRPAVGGVGLEQDAGAGALLGGQRNLVPLHGVPPETVTASGEPTRMHQASQKWPATSGPATKSCNKLRAAVMLRAGPSRRLPHAWPKTYPVDHPGGGSADPGGRRSQSPLVLVPGAACPHRPGRRRRGACRRGRLPAGVRSGHRLAHLPALRAGRADQTPAGRPPPGAPAGDFPPSSAPRSSNSPAWSPSPRGCTSRTGPARTWPARPSRTGSLKPSAPPWSVASCRRWTSSRTARATGAQRGWTSGSRSGPRRSSGATGMRSGWPAGAFGSSAPTRSPTFRCWSETRSAGPSPATSSSRSSSIPGTAPSTCCCSWWSTPARWS